MIGRLHGILLDSHPPGLLLDVNGVGYELDCPTSAFVRLPAPGQPLTLHTHLVVREDGHTLFGFLERLDRSLFRSLIRVNGVGPRLALGIVSAMPARELIAAIQQQDTTALARLPGIGRKTAQRLVLDLKDKLGELPGGGPAIPTAGPEGSAPGSAVPDREDAIAALVALGYRDAEAARRVSAVASAGLGREELIRLALKSALP